MHTLFLASPDALEVMFVSIDFTDVTLVSEDTCSQVPRPTLLSSQSGNQTRIRVEMMKMTKVKKVKEVMR